MQDAPERFERPAPAVWIVGDQADPVVAAIAGALPASTRRVDCPGDLPETAFGPSTDGEPGVIVLHRAVLTRHDYERLKRLRSVVSPPPRIVLCVGPHVRYADLVRWADVSDDLIDEATAAEVVASHVGAAPSGPGHRTRVVVVSANLALRQTIAEACEAARHVAVGVRDWSDAPGSGLVVWDVPVLEGDWRSELERHSRGRTVVALLGFGDRSLAAEARARGAAACLELPFELADLMRLIDRLAPTVRAEPAHPAPPPPAVLRRGAPTARAMADPAGDS